MMREDVRRLAIGVVIQAIHDLGLEKTVRYGDDRQWSYGPEEALKWLETYGVDIMVELGMPRQTILDGLKNPSELLNKLKDMWKGA